MPQSVRLAVDLHEVGDPLAIFLSGENTLGEMAAVKDVAQENATVTSHQRVEEEVDLLLGAVF